MKSNLATLIKAEGVKDTIILLPDANTRKLSLGHKDTYTRLLLAVLFVIDTGKNSLPGGNKYYFMIL